MMNFEAEAKDPKLDLGCKARPNILGVYVEYDSRSEVGFHQFHFVSPSVN
jgi:hypothetical protein